MLMPCACLVYIFSSHRRALGNLSL